MNAAHIARMSQQKTRLRKTFRTKTKRFVSLPAERIAITRAVRPSAIRGSHHNIVFHFASSPRGIHKITTYTYYRYMHRARRVSRVREISIENVYKSETGYGRRLQSSSYRYSVIARGLPTSLVNNLHRNTCNVCKCSTRTSHTAQSSVFGTIHCSKTYPNNILCAAEYTSIIIISSERRTAHEVGGIMDTLHALLARRILTHIIIIYNIIKRRTSTIIIVIV